MEKLLQNLRFSLRMLGQNPGMTATVLLTLALGIGANTAIFTVDYATLLAPLPYPDPNQLVMVWSKIQDNHNGVSAGDYTDWKNQSTVFQQLCAWTGTNFNIATKDQPEYIGMVTPDYFSTLGVRMVRGRALNDGDIAASVKVAVVNESFVKKWLGGRDPLHTRISVEQLIPGVQNLGPPQEWQIVGVYRDVHAPDRTQFTQEMLIPFWQSPWTGAAFAVRTAEEPMSMLHSIAAAVHSVDPDIALAQPETVDQIRSDTMSNERFTLILFGVFAAVALFLAALGIYGVMAFSVAQRSHEIAFRMALGATRGRVVTLVVREGVILAAIGLGLGLIGAYFVGRAMQSMLFDVHALDATAFSAVGLVLLLSAVLACYLPARRAASIHPMQVLRAE
jgi:putative ABC transport system permease protein